MAKIYLIEHMSDYNHPALVFGATTDLDLALSTVRDMIEKTSDLWREGPYVEQENPQGFHHTPSKDLVFLAVWADSYEWRVRQVEDGVVQANPGTWDRDGFHPGEFWDLHTGKVKEVVTGS